MSDTRFQIWYLPDNRLAKLTLPKNLQIKYHRHRTDIIDCDEDKFEYSYGLFSYEDAQAIINYTCERNSDAEWWHNNLAIVEVNKVQESLRQHKQKRLDEERRLAHAMKYL